MVRKQEKHQWYHHANAIERAILRTSHQIYSEAYPVFIKGNQFIRIRHIGNNNWYQLNLPFSGPFIPMSKHALEHIPGFVMTHTVRTFSPATAATARETTEVFAIRAQDLPIWCAALEFTRVGYFTTRNNNNNVFWLYRHEHNLTFHNPFHNTENDHDFMLCEKTQEALLQPYRTNVHRLPGFTITGNVVDAALAAAAMAEITACPIPDPAELLEELGEKVNQGKRLLHKRDAASASTILCRAIVRVALLFKSSEVWKQLHSEGGPDFGAAILNMWFTLHSNRAACVVQAMEGKNPHDGADSRLLMGMMRNVLHAVSDASGTGTVRRGSVILRCDADNTKSDELREHLRVAHDLAHGVGPTLHNPYHKKVPRHIVPGNSHLSIFGFMPQVDFSDVSLYGGSS